MYSYLSIYSIVCSPVNCTFSSLVSGNTTNLQNAYLPTYLIQKIQLVLIIKILLTKKKNSWLENLFRFFEVG